MSDCSERCIELIDTAFKMERLLKSAKSLYGEEWPKRRDETLVLIDAVKDGKELETRLAAAIEMAGVMDDGRIQVLLLAAAIDKDGYGSNNI